MTIVTIISHPKRNSTETTEAPDFEVQCDDTELSLTEQAALLRAAADQLDAAQADADPEA